MKIKLVEAGWEHYSGPISEMTFVDGVTSEHVRQDQVNRMGALMRIEVVGEEGASPAARFLRTVNDRAEVVLPMERLEPEPAPASPASAPSFKEDRFTRAELEQIADKGGIAKLRPIAAALGVKGRSIQELIDGIEKAQG